MRALIVGLRAAQQTGLRIELPPGDAQASVWIGVGNKQGTVLPAPGTVLPAPGTVLNTTVPPGDFVIAVTSDVRASQSEVFRVVTDAPVLFLTAGASPSDPRPWVVSAGSVVSVTDPKDPWPPPLLAGSPPEAAAFASSSVILGDLADLLGQNSGKGGTGPEPVVHALLIGIDGYAAGPGHDGTNYRPLRGGVRDVLAVEAFLRDAGVPADRITRLIAPGPGGAGGELAPPPDALPTYANIVAAWQRVTAAAGRGDVVYIHYSGHGGRSATAFPAVKPGELDESIAPCDVNLPDGRHLRDVEIAVLLDRMAQRGLLTTLVLDSCYAGSATRGGEVQARRGDADDLRPAGAAADTSAVAPRDELEAMARRLAAGPRTTDESWRLAAGDATTVIAACRAYESAYEYAVDGGERRGALTYFWLETLRQPGAAPSYRAAYRQTFARVHAAFREQSPVLIGAADRQVLGAACTVQPSPIAILEVHDGQVMLAAGASGLLAAGTRLAVIPPAQLPELAHLPDMVQVEVTSVQATTARARVVPDTGRGQAQITLGSQAVIVSYAPTMRREVRWVDAARDPAERAARAAVDAALAADPTSAIGPATGDGADFQLAIDDGHYAILDPAGAALPHLRPAIAVAAPDAVPRLVGRLVHLARFHNVQRLTNTDPNSPLAGKLELALHAADGDRAAREPLALRPVLACGAEFYLRIRNRSARPLSLAIFDLAGDWGIEYVNRGAPLTVDAGRSVELRLTASLPPGNDAASDLLKVIGSVEQAEFDWLALPALDQPQPAPSGSRAARTPLERLMAVMQRPSHAARRVAIAASPTFGWTEAQIGLEVRR